MTISTQQSTCICSLHSSPANPIVPLMSLQHHGVEIYKQQDIYCGTNIAPLSSNNSPQLSLAKIPSAVQGRPVTLDFSEEPLTVVAVQKFQEGKSGITWHYRWK